MGLSTPGVTVIRLHGGSLVSSVEVFLCREGAACGGGEEGGAKDRRHDIMVNDDKTSSCITAIVHVALF